MEENPFLCRKQTKDVILACLKISYGELHSVTYSQATQSWQTCTCELLTSRNLLFRPWAWFGEIRVRQTLILGRRQEGGEQGWAQGGNSREGRAKASSCQRSLETCFSYFELTSLKQLSLLLIEFPYSNWSHSIWPALASYSRPVHSTGREGAFPKYEFLYCC